MTDYGLEFEPKNYYGFRLGSKEIVQIFKQLDPALGEC